MRALRSLGLLAGCLAACLAPSPASATAVTAADVRALAAAARAGDAAALARLRAVDVVDGRPVALAVLLPADAPAEVADARLATLAAGTTAEQAGAAAVDADAARRAAATILAADRFQEEDDRGPVARALAAIGRALDPVRDLLAPLLERTVGIVALGALAVLAGILGVLLVRSRRGRAAEAADRARRSLRAAVDPAELEREADLAEAAGDAEAALRLRFEAGLVRLDHAGAIRLEGSTTSGAVRRELGSPRFDRVADVHDDVVYGERPATADDLEEARHAWPEVLEEARRR